CLLARRDTGQISSIGKQPEATIREYSAGNEVVLSGVPRFNGGQHTRGEHGCRHHYPATPTHLLRAHFLFPDQLRIMRMALASSIGQLPSRRENRSKRPSALRGNPASRPYKTCDCARILQAPQSMFNDRGDDHERRARGTAGTKAVAVKGWGR